MTDPDSPTPSSGLLPKFTDRFWMKVKKSSDCWLWIGSLNSRGYGHLSIDGEYKLAHRTAWEFEKGKIPKGKLVCHHCDTRNCVRVSHLFLGTNKDNMRDSIGKGRFVFPPPACGEKNGGSKLREHEVNMIRQLLSCGETKAKLARKFGVDEATISKIELRVTWKHLRYAP